MKLLASNFHSFIKYAEIRGIAQDELLSALNAPAIFSDPLATVSVTGLYAMVNSMTEKLGHQLLGTRIGDFSNLSSLGLIYQISLQANTISEALYYLQSYIQSTFPLLEMKISEKPDRVTIDFNITNEEEIANKVILEFVITLVAKELRLMAYKELNITLNSPYVDSGYPEDWYKNNAFSLQFNPTVLKASLQDKSRLNLDLLVPEYLKLIESLSTKDTYTSKVKFAVLHLANPQLPDLNTVAESFCLTPRTLQRKLQKEKSSFRSIIDEQKKTIAGILLRHERYSVTDISYILGFSEPASFIHTFHKWFDKSPTQMNFQTQL